ncbi:hypothetical protein CEXT_220051 [Caerostris extrusa]|uniref:Uncharacterized protein n=1 Tax=Caerostris extrusa TaxID=172846 RepID=A0AAV4NGN3_CAEEX|nr:hypothetical protein CEXT_220051 [Caerostris extrusa]
MAATDRTLNNGTWLAEEKTVAADGCEFLPRNKACMPQKKRSGGMNPGGTVGSLWTQSDAALWPLHLAHVLQEQSNAGEIKTKWLPNVSTKNDSE